MYYTSLKLLSDNLYLSRRYKKLQTAKFKTVRLLGGGDSNSDKVGIQGEGIIAAIYDWAGNRGKFMQKV